MDYSLTKPEPALDLSPEKNPTFQDIEKNTEVGIIRRGITRYLFTRNPERSIKIHTYLGAPVLRKVIMGTFGNLIPRSSFSNYRTDPSKSRLEASMRFAVGGSVFNETVHTIGAVNSAFDMISSIPEGDNPTSSIIFVALNSALVGLQRYNRARMIQSVNVELQKGASFEPEYKNWLGLDARTTENNETKLNHNESSTTNYDDDMAPSSVQTNPVYFS